MKSNFVALLVLVISGCGSDDMTSTSSKVDDVGGKAGMSSTESGGADSTSTTGGSTTMTVVAGASQGGQSPQAAGGATSQATGGSTPNSGGVSTAAGGSTTQAAGGSTSLGGSTTQPAGGKAGSGGTTTTPGGATAAGGATSRTIPTTGGTTGVACNAYNAESICAAFQTCDTVTRTCVGPVRNNSVGCSSAPLFGYTSSSSPTTALDTRMRCQAAPVVSTDPTVQNYCCNLNKYYCVVRSETDLIDCPNSGTTAGRPYIYDCVNDTQGGKLLSSGCVKATKTSASLFVLSGYCCATPDLG
jgi:hypothetical protein